MKKILIISDSLGLPRPSEKIFFEHTYPAIIEKRVKNLFNFHSINIRALTSNTILYNLKDYIYRFNPDIIFFQFGIVDCAPRTLSFNEKIFLDTFLRKSIKFKIIGILNKYHFFITKLRKINYVPKNKFINNICNIIDSISSESSEKKIVFINIVAANKNFENKSYNVNFVIKEYNNIFRKITKIYNNIDIIDMHKESKQKKITCLDGIHYNKKGNQILSKKILEYLNSI